MIEWDPSTLKHSVLHHKRQAMREVKLCATYILRNGLNAEYVTSVINNKKTLQSKYMHHHWIHNLPKQRYKCQ